ncbi:MAG TPA: helix-turn-helix transcriptional regulator [Anaeromyxobacteraceae bacterium]|nr:helix-turn-helix transcriptional regulator [Anaeromyxobacteraceae bacterium]
MKDGRLGYAPLRGIGYHPVPPIQGDPRRASTILPRHVFGHLQKWLRGTQLSTARRDPTLSWVRKERAMYRPYRDFNPSEKFRLAVITSDGAPWAGYSVYRRKAVDRLVAEDAIVSFVARGAKCFAPANGAPGQAVEMLAGDFAFVAPGTRMDSDILWKDHAYESVNFLLRRGLVEAFLAGDPVLARAVAAASDAPRFLALGRDPFLAAFVSSLAPYFAGRTPSPALARHKAFELLHLVAARLGPGALAAALPNREAARTAAFRAAVAAHAATGLKLEELAARCGMSLSMFKRTFARIYGVPPKRWCSEHRLETAAALLEAGELGVVDVALEIGFASPSHFARRFRARYGISPHACRSARNRATVS